MMTRGASGVSGGLFEAVQLDMIVYFQQRQKKRTGSSVLSRHHRRIA